MASPGNRYSALTQRLVGAAPFLWLGLFFLLPFAIVLKISFAEALIAVPPYTGLIERTAAGLEFNATLDNYRFLLRDELYVLAFLSSLRIAAISTLLCLLIGYPLAWGIARADSGTQNLLLLLVILPSWTSFLIRVYAWMGILGGNGFLNQFLLATGLIDTPLTLLRTDLAVYIGIVYTYLPFMVLPLYASLVQLDRRVLEAAADLGARPWRCFWQITLPLSRAGIVAGCLLVFIPATGEFVIPELLGGADTLMIGKVLWQEFFSNRDWPLASAVAIFLLALLTIPIIIYYRSQTTRTVAVAVKGMGNEAGGRG
jgi:putrescine transport system permease protein